MTHAQPRSERVHQPGDVDRHGDGGRLRVPCSCEHRPQVSAERRAPTWLVSILVSLCAINGAIWGIVLASFGFGFGWALIAAVICASLTALAVSLVQHGKEGDNP